MADGLRPISNAVLGERIDQQGRTLADISCDLKAVGTTLTSFMQTYGVEHQKVAGGTTAAHQRIDQLQARIDAMEKTIGQIDKSVQSLLTSNKVMIWVASGVGAMVLALLFKVFTGEASVNFP